MFHNTNKKLNKHCSNKNHKSQNHTPKPHTEAPTSVDIRMKNTSELRENFDVSSEGPSY
jgi:hypothetical protein